MNRLTTQTDDLPPLERFLVAVSDSSQCWTMEEREIRQRSIVRWIIRECEAYCLLLSDGDSDNAFRLETVVQRINEVGSHDLRTALIHYLEEIVPESLIGEFRRFIAAGTAMKGTAMVGGTKVSTEFNEGDAVTGLSRQREAELFKQLPLSPSERMIGESLRADCSDESIIALASMLDISVQEVEASRDSIRKQLIELDESLQNQQSAP